MNDCVWIRMALILVAICAPTAAVEELDPSRGIEWLDNQTEAVDRARKANKLMMRIERGRNVDLRKQKALAHPFVVDASRLFVPYIVAGEGTSLQFLSASGDQLTGKVGLTDEVAPVLKQMRDALIAGKKETPRYLDTVVFECVPKARETATVYVWCYDPGESMLGGLDGVLRSQGGILTPNKEQLKLLSEETRKKLGYKEVVEIEYDPTVLEYSTILKTASKLQCMGASVARTAAQADISREVLGAGRSFQSGQPLDRLAWKRHLGWHKSGLYHRFVPMTELQMTKLNHAVWAKETKGDQEYIDSLLFPSQVALRNEAERLRGLDAKVKLETFLAEDRDLSGVAVSIPEARGALEKACAELEEGKRDYLPPVK